MKSWFWCHYVNPTQSSAHTSHSHQQHSPNNLNSTEISLVEILVFDVPGLPITQQERHSSTFYLIPHTFQS